MTRRPHMNILLALLVAATGLSLPATALARSGIGDAANPQAFQVPWSSWPSDSTNQTGQTMSPSDADNPGKNAFADNTIHQQSYKNHGMQGGYFQQANVQLSLGGQINVFWFGSYYASAQDAASRVDDAVHTQAAAGLSGQSCFLEDQPNCHLYITPSIIYAVWSVQNGLAELALNYDSSGMVHGRDRLGHDLQKLLIAADATLLAAVGSNTSPAAAPPSTPLPELTVGINGLTIYHNVNGRLVQTKTLRGKELAVFVVTLHESNLGTYSASGDVKIYFPQGKMQLIQPLVPTDTNPATSKVIFDGTVDWGQASDGTWTAESFGSFEGESYFGPLSGVITVNLSTASDTRTFAFTLKQAPLHCKKGYKLQLETCVKKGK